MENSITVPVGRILRQLYGNGNLNKAVLASARHAASMTSPQAQAVWPVIMSELPQPLLSRNGEPTYAETATYTAIRLYAIQQQGIETCVYAPAYSKSTEEAEGMTVFSALAGLRQNEDTKTALDRRVQTVLGTTNVDSVINSLNHLVAILKSNQRSHPIDYAQLANDLFYFQMSYEQATRVRLNWGRQYFYSANKTTQTEGKKN